MTTLALEPQLLSLTLCDPARAVAYDKTQWERLVWQSRAAELMAQLHLVLSEASVLASAPAPARRHLEIASVIARRHADAVRHELGNLRRTLEPLQVPVVLLKGAAYLAMGHDAARGRIFNDVDILVPKTALKGVEQRLNWDGGFPLHTTAYDERYYRDWMHEIPPLQHKNRATVLDVHHTILPPTSGYRIDADALLERCRRLDRDPACFAVLAPEDMVVHSACHLFFGEFHKGLRDLYDLHQLLSGFSEDAGFWAQLVERATSLGLARPVLDALEQSQRLFRTRIPQHVERDLRPAATSIWPGVCRRWLFDHALRPPHASAGGRMTAFGRWLAFVRSHWLRMPLPLLAYHLSYKALLAR